MPQVLRQPEYQTERVDENLGKLLTTRSILSNPSIQQLGLSPLVIETIWGKMDRFDAEALIMGIVEIDRINIEEREKLESMKDSGKRIEWDK